MKNLVFGLGIFLASAGAFSQEIHQCATHDAILYQDAQNPGYLQSINDAFSRAKEHQSQDRSTVYTIPVVVHIVYNTPEENLHDSVIFNQIQRLNEDYRRLNSDTTNTRDTFNTIVGDSYIEFQLAMFDPSGNPTTGITRTSTTQTSFFGVGTFPADGVKSSSTGGKDPWDQSRYLNIWVCDMSVFDTPFLLGYATPPADLPHWPAGSTTGLSDGVVIQYQAFGSNNPNDLDLGSGPLEVKGRTAVHEIGHYLGLRHIWADGDCTEEDGVDDTPNAADQSDQDCNFSSNTCIDNIGVLGDLPDMVENYMDYSAETCQNSFTQGQVDMMRNILEVYRYDLINGNQALNFPEEDQHHFSIWPNPSNGVVTISSEVTESAFVFIYSETGQLIQKVEMTDQQISVEGLTQGVYFVALQTGENSIVKKLVVI